MSIDYEQLKKLRNDRETLVGQGDTVALSVLCARNDKHPGFMVSLVPIPEYNGFLCLWDKENRILVRENGYIGVQVGEDNVTDDVIELQITGIPEIPGVPEQFHGSIIVDIREDEIVKDRKKYPQNKFVVILDSGLVYYDGNQPLKDPVIIDAPIPNKDGSVDQHWYFGVGWRDVDGNSVLCHNDIPIGIEERLG